MTLLTLIPVFIAAAVAAYILADSLVSAPERGERLLETIGVGSSAPSPRSLGIDPGRLYQTTILLCFFFFALGLLIAGSDLLAGILLGTIMAVPVFFVPSVVASYKEEKRLEKINEELPGALEILSSSMFAGLTLSQAISRNLDKLPPTIAEEFRVVANECRLGSSLNDALRNWAARNNLMDVKLTVIAAELGLRHGGDMPKTFRKLAITIRERYMFQKEVRSMTTEGRMQAIVMTALPFVILVLMTLVRRKVMLDFLTSPSGMGAIGLVLAMQVAAYFWIKKAVTIEI